MYIVTAAWRLLQPVQGVVVRAAGEGDEQGAVPHRLGDMAGKGPGCCAPGGRNTHRSTPPTPRSRAEQGEGRQQRAREFDGQRLALLTEKGELGSECGAEAPSKPRSRTSSQSCVTAPPVLRAARQWRTPAWVATWFGWPEMPPASKVTTCTACVRATAASTAAATARGAHAWWKPSWPEYRAGNGEERAKAEGQQLVLCASFARAAASCNAPAGPGSRST